MGDNMSIGSNKSDLEPKLKLELLNSDTYELNDLVEGILILEINKNLNSKCIKIKLKAFGEVQWLLPNCDEDLNSNLDNFLKERENFLNCDYSVEKNYKQICEKGLHKIPFNFQLTDKKLPPTFRENNGFICYYITASIFDDKLDRIMFKTAPIYLKKVQIGSFRNDLNLPIGTNACKEFSSFCFKKKSKIQVQIYISKKGYTNGETIPIELHIINNSTHKVNTNFNLYQNKSFFCKDRQHIVEHHFEEMNASTALKGKDVKETINLKIPDNCVLSFYSRIIVVNYFIICNVNITKSVNLHLNLPIIVTTSKALST